MRSQDELVRGARVRIYSLQSAAHANRNGSLGVLNQYDPAKARWEVKFERPRGAAAWDPEALALRPDNLEFVSAPANPSGFDWQVHVHPSDSLRGLGPSIFKDPNLFAPAAGHVEQWGMEASPHDMACMMRRMTTQSMYSSFGSSIAKSPEEQWVALRKEAKRAKLAAAASAEGALCDLEIRIELVHGFEKSGAPKMLKPPI